MSDRLPICEMCRNFPGEYKFCPITARCCRDDFLYDSCSDFEQKTDTVFNRITESPETLANEFVSFDHGLYYSWFVGQYFNTYAEALGATVEKLKEVVE